jgi:hypothetical protein
MNTDPLVLLHLTRSILVNLTNLESTTIKCHNLAYPGGEPPIERVIEAARPVLAYCMAAIGRPLPSDLESYSYNSVLTQGPAGVYLSSDELEEAGVDIEEVLASALSATEKLKLACQQLGRICTLDDNNTIGSAAQVEFVSACSQLAQAMNELDPMNYA